MQQEPMRVGDVFKQLVDKSPHQVKLKEASIICAWQEMMPQLIIQRTQQVFVRDHQLFLKIHSAPLRQEIEHAKDDLLARLSAAVPEYPLRNIVWL